MTAMLPRTMTVEQFEASPRSRGRELVDGELVEKAVGNEASSISTELLAILRNFVKEAGLGRVFGSEAGYCCFPHRPKLVRKPDVSFVKSGRYPNDRPPRGFAKIAPDFVAEVISPGDRMYAVEERLDDFRRAGVPLIWVVNPDRRAITTFQLDGAIRRYAAEDRIAGEPVFPCFSFIVGDIFPPPLGDGGQQ